MDRRTALRLAAGLSLGGAVGACGAPHDPPATPATPAPTTPPTTTDPEATARPTGTAWPSAADYAWFDQVNDLTNGFSLSWVRGVSPDGVISRLDGRLIRRADWTHLYDGLGDEPTDGPFLLAIADVGGWSMALDGSGFFGIEDKPLLRLSRGTTVVYQFLNVELDDNFRLVEDGVVHVEFEPSIPDSRQGSDPDELVDAMTHVGFDLRTTAEQHAPTQTAFALTEHLTGVRLSPTLLESGSYLLASVPD